MIRTILYFFVLLFAADQVIAQSKEPKFNAFPINTAPIRFSRSGTNPDEREGIAYGLKASYNLSEFSGTGYFNDGTGYTPRSPKKQLLSGYTFGVLAEIPVSDQVYVQPEIDYTFTGSALKDSAYDQTVRLGYLNIPVVLKYKPFEGFSLFAGPQLDMLLFASYTSLLDRKAYSGNVRPDFKPLGFSMLGGVGFGFSPNLGIELRYSRSLSNINRIYNGYTFRNNAVQLGLRYFL